MPPHEGSTEGLTIRIRRNNFVVKAEVFLEPRVLALEQREAWLSEQPTWVSKALRIRIRLTNS